LTGTLLPLYNPTHKENAMNHTEACQALGINPDHVEADEVNPLRTAITYEFGRHRAAAPADYRNRAIDRCVLRRASFQIEQNTVSNAVERMISVRCPSCGGLCKKNPNSGGTYHAMGFSFSCAPCAVTVKLSLPSNFLSVEFAEKKEG
jgi:hypothetical protein